MKHHLRIARAPVLLAALALASCATPFPGEYFHVTVDNKAGRVDETGSSRVHFCRLADGYRGVFKAAKDRSEERYVKAVGECVASSLLDQLDVPAAQYRLARADGGRYGIVSLFIPIDDLYGDPALPDKILEPRRAVYASVFDCWTGNTDRMVNDGNLWVTDDGELVLGDFGKAFQPGTEALGLPKVNLRLFPQISKKEWTDDARQEIAMITDDRIDELLETAFASIGLDPEEDTLARRLFTAWAATLRENRDTLSATDPFTIFHGSAEPPSVSLEPEAARSLFARLAEEAATGDDESFSSKFVGRIFAKGRKGNYAMESAGRMTLTEELARAISAYRDDGTPPVITPANFFVYYRLFKEFVPERERRLLELGIDSPDYRGTGRSPFKRGSQGSTSSGSS